jgi:PhnB protein
MVMVEGEWAQIPNRAPSLEGTSPVVLYLYVEDVDEVVTRAEAAGARVLTPAANQFWGDRTAWVIDPSGHVWTVATRIEDTTEDERRTRLDALQRKSTTGGE